MYIDMFGKKRQKLCLHMHTTVSDGAVSPDEAAKIYKDAGYDAIAITDHWHRGEFGELEGIKIISGAEYNIGGNNTLDGVYHIVGIFTNQKPPIERGDGAQEIIDKIHSVGGLAILAHPAWSLNTPEMILQLRDIDATEIYNSVSNIGESFRADSSVIVDMLAVRGRVYPLLATDDTHAYNGADTCLSYIMVESDDCDYESLKSAIAEGRFYATQGPEIHLERDGDILRVMCSPVEHIYFASGTAWCHRSEHGEGLTYAEYTPNETDRFVRAFVVDADGRSAWSNIVLL